MLCSFPNVQEEDYLTHINTKILTHQVSLMEEWRCCYVKGHTLKYPLSLNDFTKRFHRMSDFGLLSWLPLT